MAGEAFRIVIDGTVIECLMRIVARDAADARVASDEAFAECHAVRLEADEGRSMPAIAHYGVEGAMTLTAEVGDLLGVEVLQ